MNQQRDDWEVEIRCAVARMRRTNRARADQFIHPSKMRRQPEEYLVRPALPGLVDDGYTARTLTAHKETVDLLTARMEAGQDLWTGAEPDREEFIGEELTVGEKTFIARVLALCKPCDNRLRELTFLS